ncbi:hypothetical protein HDU85_002910 [Gaertneriomyces sp. JEL0708]|nr:hypothetical protein HDU85_002910 [Gaertneriomyces sp. JEL0708]
MLSRKLLRNCAITSTKSPQWFAAAKRSWSSTVVTSQAVALISEERPISYTYGVTAASKQMPLASIRKSQVVSLSTQTSPPAAETSLPPAPEKTAHSAETKHALNLLRNQNRYYAIVEVKNRPYHVNQHDIIIAPKIKDLSLGDVIILDRVREIGSTDYMLQGNPYVDPSYFTIKATVIEHPVSREVVRVKTNRRAPNKTVVNHTHHTALRVSSIEINDL